MCHFRIFVCCVALLSSFGGCATRPTPENRAEDEKVIREMEKELSNALSGRDLGHLLSLYADDAALYYADNPMVAGRDAIRETWKAILSKPGFSMSTEPQEVQVSGSGNLAFTHGAYTTPRFPLWRQGQLPVQAGIYGAGAEVSSPVIQLA